MKSLKDNSENPGYWNNKYNKNEIGWDIGIPTPIFVNFFKKFKSKKNILIPGAGKGHDALFLSKKNHNVFAVDFSDRAISHIEKKALELNTSLNLICEDFFNLNNLNGKIDIILEYTFFCAINPNKRLKYIQKSSEFLKTDGLFVAILLPINKILNDDGPPFGVNLANTLRDFEKYYDIIECEKSDLSIKPRVDNEVFVLMRKK